MWSYKTFLFFSGSIEALLWKSSEQEKNWASLLMLLFAVEIIDLFNVCKDNIGVD